MPALCSKCHREAPCVSVEGLHCAGWQVGGPFNSMGWKCPVCLGDELFSLVENKSMHYRNGREAKNGDRVVSFGNGGGSKIETVGILVNATPGNDHCNGQIVSIHGWNNGTAVVNGACLCDCLHAEDVEAILKEKGLDKRPAGK